MWEVMAVDLGTASETFSDLLHLYDLGLYQIEEDGQDVRTLLVNVKSISAGWLDIL